MLFLQPMLSGIASRSFLLVSAMNHITSCAYIYSPSQCAQTFCTARFIGGITEHLVKCPRKSFRYSLSGRQFVYPKLYELAHLLITHIVLSLFARLAKIPNID